jgi:hypothetical protein
MAQTESEKPPSLSFTGKTALLTTLIAIALNPISIVIGYYLSQSLQAPKLEISYVEPEYGLEPLKPSPALLAAWNRDPYFRDDVYQGVQSVNPTCRGWISETVIRSSCIGEILRLTRQTLDRQIFDKAKLETEIKKIADTPNGQRFIVSINFAGSPACNAFDKEGCLGELRELLIDNNTRVEVIDKFITATEEVNRQQISRTGRVIFHAGILNQGEADSVIPPDAELTTEGRTLALRRAATAGVPDSPGSQQGYRFPGEAENASWSPRRFTPVKGRGFSEVIYEIDEGMSTGANRDNFFAAIKNKSHSEFTLKIKTPDKTLSYKGDFTG